ncbi:MAG: hypothetical protein ABW022_25185 [Actinoplanes sp.]
MTVTRARQATIAWLDSRQAARLVWLVALITLVACGVLAWKQYNLTTCQAKYAEASNASQRARAEAAEVDRRAQDRLFQSIAANPRSAVESLREYNATRAEADKRRAQNPVPPAPSTNCG